MCPRCFYTTRCAANVVGAVHGQVSQLACRAFYVYWVLISKYQPIKIQIMSVLGWPKFERVYIGVVCSCNTVLAMPLAAVYST